MIEVNNVNFEDRTLTTYDKKTKQWLMVPFGKRTAEAIRLHLDTRSIKSHYLFTNHLGEPISGYRLWKVLQELCDRAGVPRRKLHLLRNTFSQDFLMNGGSPLDLKTIAGWSTMAMVDHYTKLAQQKIAVSNYHKNSSSPADRL